MKTEKIVSSAEAWENGELGRSVEHAVVAPPGTTQQIDDALGMQMISIRLPKDLIDEFKMIAQVHNLGYQPLMRDALKRFAEAELKKLAIQYANEKAAKEQVRAKSDPCAEALTPPSRSPKRAKSPDKMAA
jgi:uncharacterized protein (DUF4415 family)